MMRENHWLVDYAKEKKKMFVIVTIDLDSLTEIPPHEELPLPSSATFIKSDLYLRAENTHYIDAWMGNPKPPVKDGEVSIKLKHFRSVKFPHWAKKLWSARRG